MHDYDTAYAESGDYFGEPSRLLVDHVGLIPEGGRVLDIGVGQGRHAVTLAEKGCRVVGVDPSAVSIEQTRAAAAAAGVDVELHDASVFDLDVEGEFDAVLCFGLMQILSRSDCASLVHRIMNWTHHGSVLYLTAWHVDDPSYDVCRAEWEKVGLHSFRNAEGERRTYLARGVIRNLFRTWKTIHHSEHLGPPHRHGDGEEHRHGDIELVAVRRD